MTRLLGLWLIAAGLLAVVGWEITAAPQADVMRERRPAVTEAVAVPEPATDLTEEWVAKILGRPLFSPDRRPDLEATTAGAGSSGLPRLTGILVGPFGRAAIFDADSRKSIVVPEGARVNAYTVKAIDAAQVRVVGPDGVRVLYPAFQSAPVGDQGTAAPQRRFGQAAAALPR